MRDSKSDGLGLRRDAIDTTSKRMKRAPSGDHAALEQRAIALLREQRFQEAAELYESLIAAGSRSDAVHGNLAALYGQQGKTEAAIHLLQRALQINPRNAEVHGNLGLIRHEQFGQIDEAIACYHKALTLRPDYPEALSNLGNALLQQGKVKEASSCFEKALALHPSFADGHKNYGNVFLQIGDLQAAITCYRKALEINPQHHEAHKNLSLVELLQGDYRNGLRRYESRFHCKDDQGILLAIPRCPRWPGNRLEAGAELLVVAEQGLGDTLQFMRYLRVLRQLRLKLAVCAPAPLHGLIRTSGIHPSPLTATEAMEVNRGSWVPMLSLAHHLAVSPERPLLTEPYIRAAPQAVARWQAILAGERRPIVAINWQGNPRQEKTTSRGRSLPLETFAPIALQSDAVLLSLQKGPGSEQLQSCSFRDRFVSCQDEVDQAWDFEETAAIIANCDLVISSDTAVAHLAGGMGRPTWLLLKKVPEWRWGLKGESSFWYPSMQLFRQRRAGDWPEVLERVADALGTAFGG